MKLTTLTILLVIVLSFAVQADQITLTKNGWDHDGPQYNLNNEQNTQINLLANYARYIGLGPASPLTSAGAVQEAGLAAAGTSVWTLVTCEAAIDGVLKYIYATAEILAWQSADTLEAGETCYYLATFDGSSTNPNTSITITQGAEYNATTETPILPAIPAAEAPICALKIKSVTSAFVPSTTNFNASGVTTTFYTFRGPIPSGTSEPADVDMTVDRY